MTEQHYQKFLSTVGPEWPGFAGIDNLMILCVFTFKFLVFRSLTCCKHSGDSYTDVLYDSRSPHPTREEPLGVPFPGRTFTETGNLMNWVGYLVENRIAADQPVLVYDYAVGGHRVVDVAGQIHDQFMPIVGQKPDWAPWKSGNTLFSESILPLQSVRPSTRFMCSHMDRNQRLWVGVSFVDSRFGCSKLTI